MNKNQRVAYLKGAIWRELHNVVAAMSAEDFDFELEISRATSEELEKALTEIGEQIDSKARIGF